MARIFAYHSGTASISNVDTSVDGVAVVTNNALFTGQGYNSLTWWSGPSETGYIIAKGVSTEDFPDPTRTWIYDNATSGVAANSIATNTRNFNTCTTISVSRYNFTGGDSASQLDTLSSGGILYVLWTTGHATVNIVSGTKESSRYDFTIAGGGSQVGPDPTPGDNVFFGGAGNVQFWMSDNTEAGFVKLANNLLSRNDTTGAQSKTNLINAQYWSSF